MSLLPLLLFLLVQQQPQVRDMKTGQNQVCINLKAMSSFHLVLLTDPGEVRLRRCQDLSVYQVETRCCNSFPNPSNYHEERLKHVLQICSNH
jgi:hypothetical protein